MAAPLATSDLDLILDGTRDLWAELRGKRIFTRSPEAFREKCPHLTADPAVILHAGDVRTFAFPDGEFAYVIHAATEARARQAAEAPLEMLSTIVAGTERALQFASTHATAKFLLTSSGAVYGPQPSDLTHVPETYHGAPDPLQPASVYAEGKRISELICALYSAHSTLECKIARCWAFCGPHLPLDEHFAIGNFIGDTLAGRPIRIAGDGTPRRSYLYAADLTIWLWTILFRAPAMLPINVGSDEDLSILELAQAVATTLRPQTEIHVAKVPVVGASPSRYVPNVDRAGDLLSLRQTVSLQDAIRRTAAWNHA
jgi:nucleoside-diphosphate-sugar epimerase